jgi:DUF1365 family protein
MTATVDHIQGQTFHGRKGDVKNSFRYSIDYVLLDAEKDVATPSLFGRNSGGVMSVQDVDHGGVPKGGHGAAWVRGVLETHEITGVKRIELLAQPRVLGHVFNPVSFWLCRRANDDALIAVIAEVTNTFGVRHSYLVHHPDLRPINPTDRLAAQKFMHVSPFQPVEGGYVFRFDISDERIGVWIDYSRGKGGVIATLSGVRRPISNSSILSAIIRRPFGSRRVLGLIHWQAVKLWFRGAKFRSSPTPPTHDVTRG